MTVIGKYLVSRGHRVIVLTGSRFADRVTSGGMEFRALGGNADFDDRDVPSYLPDRGGKRGLALAQYDIQTIFVKTIPAQYRAMREILDAEELDAIIVDSAFAGVGPLLLDPAADRPPILAVGITPLSQSSRDVAPYGTGMAPSSTLLGRLRNRTLGFLASKLLFRETQRCAERMFAEVGAPPLRHFVMDISSAFDRFLQLTVQDFEYSRSDLAPNTVFIGPLPVETSDTAVPEWWGDLDGTRPVIHVTQGTIDNHDLSRLIRPTIEALAGVDCLVIVTMGGRDSAALGTVPDNVRVADYLPYDLLLPLADVVVTNGGYGGVQQALTHGVPLIVAGDTEDKPEVAARVAWSGAGTDLSTGTPNPSAILAAVSTILDDSRFRLRAQVLGSAMQASDPFGDIDRQLARLIR